METNERASCLAFYDPFLDTRLTSFVTYAPVLPQYFAFLRQTRCLRREIAFIWTINGNIKFNVVSHDYIVYLSYFDIHIF